MSLILWVIGVVLGALLFIILADWVSDRQARKHPSPRCDVELTLFRAHEVMDRVDAFLDEIGPRNE